MRQENNADRSHTNRTAVSSAFQGSDCDDLFEILSQLADDEFEGYPGISWKTARNVPSWKLLEKLGLRREVHFRQNIWFHRDENDNPIWKDTLVYAILEDEASR